MTQPRFRSFAPVLLSLVLVACDNVGRAFDRNVDPNDPGAGTIESAVAVVPVGGEARNGRPKVRATYPTGGGWPPTVPVVVEFSESVNQASIEPTSTGANDARLILRLQGTTQSLPCTYDFLEQGRLLVMRPVTALSNAQAPIYEVVLLPDARDCDGVRFDVPSGGSVLAEFQVNQDPSFADGRILAVYPRENVADVTRESDVVVVFDRPATTSTVVRANLQVRLAGGADLDGNLTTPLSTVGVADGRVARFRPTAALAASTEYELVVTADILFGNGGVLDFRGRTPYSNFQTVAPRAPSTVALANPVTGFPDKINLANFANATLRVTLPDEAAIGDVVRARIYGGDRSTTPTGDLRFVERTADVTQNGAQTVDVSFADQLGTTTSPKFDDDELVFAAQLVRGSQGSSYIQQPGSSNPIFDVTAPTVQRAGPPGSTDGRDLWCDTEHVAFYGVASERLGQATLDDGVNPPVNLFGADNAGRFLMAPLLLGRLQAPRAYQLTVRDAAGNDAATNLTGNLVQRGVCTGVQGGTLVVEVYDQATLQPLPGAKIVVDPGVPVVPASGQAIDTADAAGRATFSGLTAPRHTITVVLAGYDLLTLYETGAAFVSLPLRPRQASTADFTGNVGFTPGAGVTAIVGNTAFDDRGLLGVRTTNASPTSIPVTPIVPNRAQVVTGFAGTFEPTANPPFTAYGTNLLSTTATVAPPTAPAQPGTETRVNLVLASTPGSTSLVTYNDDFASAVGFDLGNLVGGGLRVRMTASLVGFEGQSLLGLGFVSAASGSTRTFDATYVTPLYVGLASFQPRLWSVVEGQDTGGHVIRSRVLILPELGNFLVNSPGPLAVPGITTPAGPSSGPPAVEFGDVLDPASAPGALATADVTATDAADRRWVLLRPDNDATGGTDIVQFPDLAAAGVPGLALGNWSLRVEARLWFSNTAATIDDFVLGDRIRNEVDYARAAPVTFVVQ